MYSRHSDFEGEVAAAAAIGDVIMIGECLRCGQSCPTSGAYCESCQPAAAQEMAEYRLHDGACTVGTDGRFPRRPAGRVAIVVDGRRVEFDLGWTAIGPRIRVGRRWTPSIQSEATLSAITVRGVSKAEARVILRFLSDQFHAERSATCR